MPDEIGENTNSGVAELYTNTAGGRVRFSTDSDYVIIRAFMDKKPAPMLNPETQQPVTFDELSKMFCAELAKQELNETDEYIKNVWLAHFENELTHLKKVAELLYKYEGKHYEEVLITLDFPELLSFKENKSYVREVLKNIRLTSQKENYVEVNSLKSNNTFEGYQKAVVKNPLGAPSHKIIDKYINKFGEDLRYETAPHPEKELRDRQKDNYEIGRIKNA